MKIKKLLTVALAGVMATAAFAGCSTKENEGSNVANDNKTYTIGVGLFGTLPSSSGQDTRFSFW